MTTSDDSAVPGVFDLSQLLRACAQRPERKGMLLTLLTQLVLYLPRDMAAARKAWERGEFPAAAALIHGARGALASIGAHRFDRCALALEQQLNAAAESGADRVLAGAGGAFTEAETELAATVAAARQWLANQPPSPP